MAVHVPVSRTRALTRAILLGTASTLGLAISAILYRSIDLSRLDASRRLVAVCLGVAGLPIVAAVLATAIAACRWLMLACWPGKLGAWATRNSVVLRLGPFGTRAYDADRLDVRYLFELSGDEEEGGFEAFVPEEKQRAKTLPRMLHPTASEPIQRVILRFAAGGEAAVAAAMRPVVEAWRGEAAWPTVTDPIPTGAVQRPTF
ncbi:MAG: hypothetical protein AABZ12_06285 [Planctomycetota bacterium]